MSFISSTGVDPKHMAWKSGYTEGEAKFAYIKQSYVRATMSYLLDLLTYRYHRTESHSPTQSRTSHSTVTKSFLMALPLSIPRQVHPSLSLSLFMHYQLPPSSQNRPLHPLHNLEIRYSRRGILLRRKAHRLGTNPRIPSQTRRLRGPHARPANPERGDQCMV